MFVDSGLLFLLKEVGEGSGKLFCLPKSQQKGRKKNIKFR